MAKQTEEAGGVTRRGFLKGVLAGLGSGAVVLTIFGGKRMLARRRSVAADFPEDSIFAPAKDRSDRV